MLYYAVVGLTMFVAPLVSIFVDHAAGSSWLWLTGKWFVFWGVGVRLGLAGLRQIFQPAFTSREIMGIETPEAFLLVREIGAGNLAAGVVGLASLAAPSFVLPSALGAAIFYALAALGHVRAKHRGGHETVAMISDVFIAVVLAGFVTGALLSEMR